jgi:hypothetical protein
MAGIRSLNGHLPLLLWPSGYAPKPTSRSPRQSATKGGEWPFAGRFPAGEDAPKRHSTDLR